MARKKKNEAQDSAAKSGGYGMAKLVLALLLVGDLAAGGTYFYFQHFQLKKLDSALRSNERGVVWARTKMKNLRAAATTILEKRYASIKDPGSLILQVAEAMNLKGKVRAARPVSRRWKRSNYDEISVKVTFVEKEGYHFGDLISFLEAIEKKNPKLLIKNMDFGERERTKEQNDPLGEPDLWRPNGAALTVRTFRLRT